MMRMTTVHPRAAHRITGRSVAVALATVGAAVTASDMLRRSEPPAVPDAERTTLTGDRQVGDFVVATFNIRYGTANDGDDHWNLRRDSCIQAILRLDGDIVGLQEALAFQIDEIRAALPGHTVVGAGRADGRSAGEHCAIIVRDAAFEIVAHETFWFSDTPSVPGSRSFGNSIPRICTWATLRSRTCGTAIRVFNVHFDHQSQPSRERSAQQLISQIGRATEDMRVMVLGDFNAGPSNPAFRALVEAPVECAVARPLSDTWRISHPDDAEPAGTFHAFRGEPSGPRIDAVLVDQGWTVRAVAIDRRQVGGRWPSDHFPVVARLRIAVPQGADRAGSTPPQSRPDDPPR